MGRGAPSALIVIAAWGAGVLPGLADDADRCVHAAGREAIAACDRVIASADFGSRGRAVAYYQRARARLETGDRDGAIADFDASIGLDPANAFTFNDRGIAWYFKGDRARAIADFDKAIERDAAYALAFHNRGEARNDSGDVNGGIADYGKAIELDPGYVAAFTDRGLAREHLGDRAGATADFRAAVALPPKYGDGEQAQATARRRLAALAPRATPPAPPVVAAPRGRRVALVIGNSAYTAVTALGNPASDTELVAGTLRRAGFEAVTRVTDLGREKFLAALQDFARGARDADWAVVYFAGHGIEIDGVNYLVPVDARLETDRDAKLEAVSLDQVLAAVEGAHRLRLVMLDACRNNPFTQMRSTTPTRGVNRGLAPAEPASGTLVVYAAKHGQVALDGDTGNSPFAAALARDLPTPGVEVEKLFRIVHDDVMAATGGRQETFTYGALPGREDYYFVSR